MAMGAAGIATFGLTALCYKGDVTRMEMMKSPEMQKQMFHPEVQRRLRTTMGYFGAACTGTGVFMHLFRNSSLAYMNPFLYMGLSFGALIGIHMCDYQTNWLMKNLLYAGWVGLVSTSLVPLIHMYSMPILFDAALATGATIASLGAVAYFPPSQQFLNMGGVLSLGLGG